MSTFLQNGLVSPFEYINNIVIIRLSRWSMVLCVSDVDGVIQRMGWGSGVMGKLRRAGRKVIHSWPRPLCIIVPSDPVNILNHQSKQSDPPVNTQGEALHSTPLYYCPGFSGQCGPSETSTHTHGLRLANCSWVAALFKIDAGSIHIWCYHLEMLEWRKVMPILFIFFYLPILSMFQLSPCKSKTERISL